jgi:hypothetical protein
MKTFGKFSFALALLAFGLSLSTSRAAAQSLVSGTFKLPVEAHWGRAVLPTGDYSFAVELHGSGPMVTVRQADGKCVGLFFSRSVTQIAESGTQNLVLTASGNDMYVSSFQLGAVGLELDYNLPKVVEAAMGANLPAHRTSAMLSGAAH